MFSLAKLTAPLTRRLTSRPTRFANANSPAEGVGGDPISILGSSLIAWWTADRADLISLSGSAVTSWRDVTHGYDAAQAVSASRPAYSATSFNGAPAVTFDGADDELTATDVGLLAALPDGAEPGFIINIAGQSALPADTGLRYALSYGGSINVARRQGREVVTGVNRGRTLTGSGAANSAVTDTLVDLSTRHVLISEFTATAQTVNVDNAGATSGAIVPATSITRLRLGAGDGAAAATFWNGPIRDSIITTGPIASDVWARLMAWALPRRRL